MSGLLAARVLSDHFDLVTVVERDVLPADAGPRHGVPQGRHGHVLLPRGSTALEELFPGLLAELAAAGVPVSESLDQLHVELNGHVFFRDGSDERSRRGSQLGRLYQPTRPLLEARVRERVRSIPNVAFMDGCDIVGLSSNHTSSRVIGALVAPQGQAQVSLKLSADLVVAATGRSGRVDRWLETMGYASPLEDKVRVDIRYVTRRVRLPAGSVDPLLTVLVGPAVERPTGGFAFAQEDDQWVVTLNGYAGHHPPTALRRTQPIPGRVPRHRRRRLDPEPGVRPGHDGRRARGTRPSCRSARRMGRTGPPLLPGSGEAGR